MKKLTQIATWIAVFAILAAPAFADTLVLKSGEKVSGYFEGGSARVIKFRSHVGAVTEYDLLSVQQISFGDDRATSTSTSSPATKPPSSSTATSASSTSTPRSNSTGSSTTSTSSNSSDGPRLRSNSERATRPTSANAANTGWTIPTGSTVVIRMIDSVNSEKNKVGDQFVAVIDEPVMEGGVEVIPVGADVRGRIANINEAGRVAGAAQLGVELTQIIVNGIPYSVTTSEYQEAAENRGTQTAKRAAVGAGVGAIIGAIAGGGKGAAIGAGVGGGGATAVQVLTKGDKLNIPSETRLEFTLRAPLVVAGK
jgi:hypothetical protein